MLARERLRAVTGAPAASSGGNSPAAAAAVSMKTAKIGSAMVLTNGHPLYTYVGDTSPGQSKGNDLNADGGLWTEITLSVSTAGGRWTADDLRRVLSRLGDE